MNLLTTGQLRKMIGWHEEQITKFKEFADVLGRWCDQGIQLRRECLQRAANLDAALAVLEKKIVDPSNEQRWPWESD